MQNKKCSVYYFTLQCSNGHLMCAGCLMHLLADGRLKDEAATCPSCRCEISKTGCIRNLAVEKAISEMPALCQHCAKAMPRHTVDRHERELCAARCVANACQSLTTLLLRDTLLQAMSSLVVVKNKLAMMAVDIYI